MNCLAYYRIYLYTTLPYSIMGVNQLQSLEECPHEVSDFLHRSTSARSSYLWQCLYGARYKSQFMSQVSSSAL
jgi:hypothetical protein